jgi:hypothetical protein
MISEMVDGKVRGIVRQEVTEFIRAEFTKKFDDFIKPDKMEKFTESYINQVIFQGRAYDSLMKERLQDHVYKCVTKYLDEFRTEEYINRLVSKYLKAKKWNVELAEYQDGFGLIKMDGKNLDKGLEQELKHR